jgi:energy-coupling factor transporter ATP-binding protein EcfA2
VTAGARFAGNPFPGLRPFESDEEHLFFGREIQVDDLLLRLARKRFVAVVGASGSGKSSLVRAGLLPAVYGGFMVAAGSQWYAAVMRPGRTPIASLARALLASGALGDRAGDPVLRAGLVQAVLERGALGLVEAVADARLRSGESVLVLIDQFEELFRFKATDAVAFVKLLLAAVSQSQYPIYVVITMRSDFLGDASQYRNLPELIGDSLFLVPRLTRAQFQQAIEGPIRVAGGRITPRLTNRLLNDLEDDADQLPVLQHALMRTWKAYSDRGNFDLPIDLPDLEAIGALSEALSRHGDEVYASLQSNRLREVAERVFKALTDQSEDNRGARRPTRFAELCAIVDAQHTEVKEVLDAFRAPGCSFIMPPPAVPIDDDTVLDISHESLMRIWKTLQRWVDEEAQSAQIYRRLAGAASLYREGKAALWRDPDLEIAVAWREQNQPTAQWGERIAAGYASAMQFLEESLAERSRERRERSARMRAALVALAIVVVALAALSATAFSQWRIADASLKVERAERLADISLQEPAQLRTAALLAADAYGMAKTPRTMGAMLEELLRLHVLRGAGIASATNEAFADRGRLLAVVADPSGVALPQLNFLDGLTLGAVAHGPIAGISRVRSLCGSSDSDWFAVFDGRTILLYRGVEKGAPKLVASRRIGPAGAIACLPGSPAVVLAARGGLWIFDLRAALSHELSPSNGSRVVAMAASPSGQLFAAVSTTQSSARLDLFDLRTRTRVASVPLHADGCGPTKGCASAAFSPDGTRLAWLDGKWLRTARVPTLSGSISSPCGCKDDAVLAYGADGSGPRALAWTGGSAPVYDPYTEIAVTRDRSGIEQRALDGTTAPALGSQTAPVWPGAFASIGDHLVLAGSNAIHVYDLDEYRASRATAADVSRTVRISDPGDGVHAVALDYPTGVARLMIVDPAVKVTGEVRVHAAAAASGSFADDPEVGYDPMEQQLTEAWMGGISRYAANGTQMTQSSWETLASSAGLPSWSPGLPYDLSSRGSYVRLLRPSLTGVPSSATPDVALVSTAGGTIARFVSTPTISTDERFAIGLRADDQDTTPGLYRLPQGVRIPDLDLPDTAIAAIAPNGRTIAYATGGQSERATDIQLLDAATDSRIGPPLPGPPDSRSIDNIAFSDDARYLLASYRVDDAARSRRVLIVYSIDPADWQRTLCFWGGVQPERSEPSVTGRALSVPNACAKFVAQMVR